MISEKEKEIFCRLAAGEEIKTVAVNMNMHSRNVDYHISQVKRRYGANSTVQLIVMLTEKGELSE